MEKRRWVDKIKIAASKVLPKSGQNGFDWTFTQSSMFVLRYTLVLNCNSQDLILQIVLYYVFIERLSP